MSAYAIEILRHRDLVGFVERAALHQHTFTLAEIDSFLVEPLEPGVMMLVGEEEEQPFDFHAAAIGEKFLETARTEIEQALYQHLGLMKTLAFRQFIKKLERGALGRRYSERPIPLPPTLDRPAVLHIRIRFFSTLKLREPFHGQRAAKQFSVVVIDEARVERQLVKPDRGRLGPVEMDLLLLMREVMSVALQFERGAAADEQGIIQQGLK